MTVAPPCDLDNGATIINTVSARVEKALGSMQSMACAQKQT